MTRKDCLTVLFTLNWDIKIRFPDYGKIPRTIAGMLKDIKAGREIKRRPASCQQGIKRDYRIWLNALFGTEGHPSRITDDR